MERNTLTMRCVIRKNLIVDGVRRMKNNDGERCWCHIGNVSESEK